MAGRNSRPKQLKILNWNANGLRAKVGELIHFLNKHKIDLAVLTETKLDPNFNLKIRNYNIFRYDRNMRGGGVAILTKNCLPCKLLPHINSNIENISIMLENGTVFVGGYAPPNLNFF